MGEHVISWPLAVTERGMKSRHAVCTCGWTGRPGDPSAYVATATGEQKQEAEQHRLASVAHDVAEVEHSGKYVRVACECGHKGDWRHSATASLQRLLHSDINAHIWALKRMEAGR